MAINFPDSPTLDEEFTASGRTWIWDGTAWVAAPVEIQVEVADITDLTATATELNFVDGVTSPVQTQLDAKAPLANPVFTGTLDASDATIRAGMAGGIEFYGELEGVTAVGQTLYGQGDTSNPKFISLPNADGTLALTSDLDAKADVSHTHNITEISQDVVSLEVSQYVNPLPSGLENKLVILTRVGGGDIMLQMGDYIGTPGSYITFAFPPPQAANRPSKASISTTGSFKVFYASVGDIMEPGAEIRRWLWSNDSASAATMTFIDQNSGYFLGNLHTDTEAGY